MSTGAAPKRPITCPYCSSTSNNLFSLYGNSLLSSQYYCRDCHTIFDVVRFDDEDDQYSVASNQSEEPL